MEQGEPPLVNTAANLFRRYCYENREKRTAGILCAGWDKREGGQVRGCAFKSCVPNVVIVPANELVSVLLIMLFKLWTELIYSLSFSFSLGVFHSPWWYVCETTICHRWLRQHLCVRLL